MHAIANIQLAAWPEVMPEVVQYTGQICAHVQTRIPRDRDGRSLHCSLWWHTLTSYTSSCGARGIDLCTAQDPSWRSSKKSRETVLPRVAHEHRAQWFVDRMAKTPKTFVWDHGALHPPSNNAQWFCSAVKSARELFTKSFAPRQRLWALCCSPAGQSWR